MGDTEYQLENVDEVEVELRNELDDLPNVSTVTESLEHFEDSTECSQPSPVPPAVLLTTKVEPSSQDPDMQGVKGKTVKEKQVKACKYCKKTFYHLFALRSHVRYCSRSKLERTAVFNSGNISVKKEVLTDSESRSSISADSLPNKQDTAVDNEQLFSQTFESESPFIVPKKDVMIFKGTDLKRVCEGCGLRFKSITHARSHLSKKKTYCRRPPYKCKRCGKDFKSVHSVVDHEKSKVSCKKWLWSIQNAKYLESMQTAIDGTKHLETVKLTGSDDVKVNLSAISEAANSGNKNLSIFGRIKEGSPSPAVNPLDPNANADQDDLDFEPKLFFTCQKCGLKFLNSYRLRKHALLVHRKISPQSTRSNPTRVSSTPKKDGNNMSPFKCEGGYRCPTCEMIFTYPSRLSSHLFRKGKCYPPGFVKNGSKQENSLDLSRNLFLEYSKKTQEGGCLVNSHERKGIKREFKTERRDQDHDLLSSICEGFPNSDFVQESQRPIMNVPKQKIIKQKLPKYTKINHQAGGIVPFCDVCQLSFCNKATLSKHFQKYHSSPEEFDDDAVVVSQSIGCPFCDRLFNTIKARNTHVRYGHKELHAECELFLQETQCDVCARAFESVSEKQDHCSALHENHSEVQFSISTNTSESLKCIRCNAQFTTKHHYSAHVNRYCTALKDNDKLASPTQEDVSEILDLSRNPRLGGKKLKSKHTSNLSLKCFKCGAQFSTKHHYSAHVNKHCIAKKRQIAIQENVSEGGVSNGAAAHPTSPIKRAKEEYMCAHCQTKFSYRTLYKAHVNRYCPMKQGFQTKKDEQPSNNNASFSCPYCQMTFHKKNEYDTHVRNLCSVRPTTSSSTAEKLTRGPWYGKKYSCGGCRNVFQSRKTLYVHQKAGCTGITFGPGSDEELIKKADKSTDEESASIRDKNWPGVGFSYVCRGCRKRFNSRKVLYYHQKTVCRNALRNVGGVNKGSHELTSIKNSDEDVLTCKGCHNTFSSKKSLYNHQKSVCKKFPVASNTENKTKLQETLTGPLSAKEGTKSDDLSNVMLYTCRGCQTPFKTRKDLYAHKITDCVPTESEDLDDDDDDDDDDDKVRKHKTGFACKRCSKRCHSRKVLYVHQKFQCKFSKFKSSTVPVTKSTAVPSTENSNPPENSDLRNYRCHGCQERFTSRKDMFVHQKYHCSGRKHDISSEKDNNEVSNVDVDNFDDPASEIKYNCANCKTGFSNRRDLHVHKKQNCPALNISKVTTPQEEIVVDTETSSGRKYACKMCSNVCANRKVLYLHHKFDCPGRNGDLSQKSGKDDICCSTGNATAAEISEKLEKFPNQCPYCNRQYCNPFVRDRHIRLHTMVKAFRCPFCPQTFSRSEYLTRHLQNDHSERLRYQCGQCGLKREFPNKKVSEK